MKKKLFFTGMLAMALTFGLILTGCPTDADDDGGGGGGGGGGGASLGWTKAAGSSDIFGANYPIKAITWGGGKFIAGGYGGKIAYSPDGITWTAVTGNPFNSNSISGIAWGGSAGNEKFVAVSSTVRATIHSPDGVNWTYEDDQLNLYASDHFNGIVWGGGYYIAVGVEMSGQTIKVGAIAARSATGTNGWGRRFNTAILGHTLNGIVYDGSKFVAVGYGGKVVYSSDNGATWTAVSDSVFSGYGVSEINGIAWGGGKFVTAGDAGRMAYSSDGVTWTAVSDSTFGSEDIKGIAWGGGKFVAVGENNKIAYSSDGVTWTAETKSAFAPYTNIKGIAWGGNRFVAVSDSGIDGGAIAYSAIQE
jgi:hypothetical protein